MSRIVVSTIGVRGDLNPFLGLGQGLRARGHEVVFAVESAFRKAVADEGFESRPLTGDILTALAPHERSIFGGRTAVAAVRPIVREWLTADLPAKVADLEAACAGADLLVVRAAHLAAPLAAERLGLPWAQVTLTALTVPSADADPRLLPLPASRLGNRVSWAAIELFTRRLADGPVNKVRRDLGLSPARNVMGRGGHSRRLTAIAVSSAVSPPQPDWPPYVKTTGYCFWDVPTGWREPAELTRFLEAPGPVVAVSFGSMVPFVQGALAHLYETAVGAVLAAGARALVVGASMPSADRRVLVIPFAPFSQVYPRCAAAIHHGGPYTVGEALRAGIPSLAVPWGIDQFFTAAQLACSGAGRARHHRYLNARNNRRDVEALLTDASLRCRAEALAARLAEEDGVGTLCDALERVLERSGEPSKP